LASLIPTFYLIFKKRKTYHTQRRPNLDGNTSRNRVLSIIFTQCNPKKGTVCTDCSLYL